MDAIEFQVVNEVEEDSQGTRSCDDILDDPNRGRLLLDIHRVLRHPLLFLKITDPFITSHHPSCSHFEDHSVTFHGRRWCIGCTFNSLSFFGAMVILLIIWLFDETLLNRFYLFWGGGLAILLYFLVSLSNITEGKKRAKVLSKFLLGSGFAFLCWSILLIDGLVSPILAFKMLFILVLYLGFVTGLNIKRSHEIVHECETCEYMMRWSKCPGFREIVCRLVTNGFVNPEKRDAKN